MGAGTRPGSPYSLNFFLKKILYKNAEKKEDPGTATSRTSPAAQEAA
tara:strand:+ start:209 stop:349 length:141 start_codon:yes stop_codon:yes gene_type:complete